MHNHEIDAVGIAAERLDAEVNAIGDTVKELLVTQRDQKEQVDRAVHDLTKSTSKSSDNIVHAVNAYNTTCEQIRKLTARMLEIRAETKELNKRLLPYLNRVL